MIMLNADPMKRQSCFFFFKMLFRGLRDSRWLVLHDAATYIIASATLPLLSVSCFLHFFLSLNRTGRAPKSGRTNPGSVLLYFLLYVRHYTHIFPGSFLFFSRGGGGEVGAIILKHPFHTGVAFVKAFLRNDIRTTISTAISPRVLRKRRFVDNHGRGFSFTEFFKRRLTYDSDGEWRARGTSQFNARVQHA